MKTSLDKDSDRHRDLQRRIRTIRRQDSLQSYNKIEFNYQNYFFEYVFGLKLSVFPSFKIVYFLKIIFNELSSTVIKIIILFLYVAV